MLPGGLWHLEDDATRMANQFGCNIDDLASEGGRVGRDWDCGGADILFERLVEIEGQQHGVIEGGILGKLGKGELLGSEIFEGAMHQFIFAPVVVIEDKGFRVQEGVQSRFPELFLEKPAVANVGVEHGMRTGKVKEQLTVGTYSPTVDGTAEPFPTSPPIPELDVLPDGSFAFEARPSPLGSLLRQGLHVTVELTGTKVADLQGFKRREELLIKKAGITTDDNGNVPSVMLADLPYDMINHLLNGIGMIAVVIPGAKHGIDQKTVPCHLQRCEPLDLLVSVPDTVPLVSVMVVQNHRIDAKDDNFGLGQLQPPQEKLLQQSAEQINSRPPEGPEEPLHGMAGEQSFRSTLNHPGISRIVPQMIEIGQVPTGAIHKKTEKLLEDFGNRLTFPASADRSEKTFQRFIQSNAFQITNEKAQPTTTTEALLCGMNTIDFGTLTSISCGNIAHTNLPPVGLMMWNRCLRHFIPQYHKLNPMGGFSFAQKPLDLGYRKHLPLADLHTTAMLALSGLPLLTG
jgi:hypothetical protein